jgi:hypothetical protein
MGRFKKESIYANLSIAKSKYAVLYRGSYPTQDSAYSTWQQQIGNSEQEDTNAQLDFLSYEESSAIVNWVYRAMKNAQEREDFTKELFRQIKDLHSIQNNIRFSKGVVYNSAKVEINFLSSISGVNGFLETQRRKGNTLFYRDMLIQTIHSARLL